MATPELREASCCYNCTHSTVVHCCVGEAWCKEHKIHVTHTDVCADFSTTPIDTKLKDAVRKMLPVVESAYYDHHGAGISPGSGYSHNCYRLLPFTWRQEAEFAKWLKEVKELLD